MPLPRTAAVLAALAVLLAGCGLQPSDSPADLSEEDRVNRQAELAARPSLEAVVARYEQMQATIRDRLDAELGPFDWRIVREGDEGTCAGTFPGMGGVTRNLPPWGFDAGIPDADWPRAEQIITETVTEYGFETPTLQIDEPGRHKTTAADVELGAQFDFGTQVNTTMQVTTGCHLRQADRR